MWSETFIPSSNALVRKKWKYIDWYKKDHTQLFNLEDDPLELYDVKDDPANAEVVAEMSKKLIEYRDELKEPDIGCEYGDYSFNAVDEQPTEVSVSEAGKMEALKSDGENKIVVQDKGPSSTVATKTSSA